MSDTQLPDEHGIMAHIEKEQEMLRGDIPGLPEVDPSKTFASPHFMIPMNSVKQREGSDAHFACKVEPADDPRLRILWLRNGKPLVAGKW